MSKQMSLTKLKNHILRCWIVSLSKLDQGSCVVSSGKTACKKMRALAAMKFQEVLFKEVVIYPYWYTIWPCMECCCHACSGAPNCYLNMLDKLQTQECSPVGSSQVTCL